MNEKKQNIDLNLVPTIEINTKNLFDVDCSFKVFGLGYPVENQYTVPPFHRKLRGGGTTLCRRAAGRFLAYRTVEP